MFIIVQAKAAINVQVKLMHSELADRAYSSQLHRESKKGDTIGLLLSISLLNIDRFS